MPWAQLDDQRVRVLADTILVSNTLTSMCIMCGECTFTSLGADALLRAVRCNSNIKLIKFDEITRSHPMGVSRVSPEIGVILDNNVKHPDGATTAAAKARLQNAEECIAASQRIRGVDAGASKIARAPAASAPAAAAAASASVGGAAVSPQSVQQEAQAAAAKSVLAADVTSVPSEMSTLLMPIKSNDKECTSVMFHRRIVCTVEQFSELMLALRINTHVSYLGFSAGVELLQTVSSMQALVDMLRQNRSIDRFWIGEDVVSPELVTLLAEGIAEHPQLNTFSLLRCRLSLAASTALLSALARCTTLQKVDFHDCGQLSISALIGVLCNCSFLGSFYISLCELTSDDNSSWEHLLSIVALHRVLENCRLPCARLDDQRARVLADTILVSNKLTEIYIMCRESTFTPVGASALLRAVQCNSTINKFAIADEKGNSLPISSSRLSAEVRTALNNNAEHASAAVAVAAEARIKYADECIAAAERIRTAARGHQTAAASFSSGEAASSLLPRLLSPDVSSSTPLQLNVTTLVGAAVESSPSASAAASASASFDDAAFASSLITLPEQVSRLQSIAAAHSPALSHLSAEHASSQRRLCVLRCILGNVSARAYHDRFRVLLRDTLIGASAARSDYVDAAVQTKAKIVRAILGAAASVPVVGTAASAVSALVGAADARALNAKLQRLVDLTGSPVELTHLLDTLAVRLTLMRWSLLTDADALHALLTAAGKGVKQRAEAHFDAAKAKVQQLLQAEEERSAPEQLAAKDVEQFVLLIGAGEQLSLGELPPSSAVHPQQRAEWITSTAVHLMLPEEKKSDEQELLQRALADSSLTGSGVVAQSSCSIILAKATGSGESVALVAAASSAVSIAAAATAAHVSPPPAVTSPSAELEQLRQTMLAQQAEMAELRQWKATKAAEEAERQAQQQAREAVAVKAREDKDAANEARFAAYEARLKKAEEATNAAFAVDAGGGLVYAAASASPLSPQQQREADARIIQQLQLQADDHTRHLQQLACQIEDLKNDGHWQDAEVAAAARTQEEEELASIRARLNNKKNSQRKLSSDAQHSSA